jgi:hypothetical protein
MVASFDVGDFRLGTIHDLSLTVFAASYRLHLGFQYEPPASLRASGVGGIADQVAPFVDEIWLV